MKKLILFALASLSIISCRKDDDESQATIVGTWKIDKHITRYGNGSTVTDVLDDCEIKTNITFSNDGTVSSVGYFKSDESSTNCQIHNSKGTYDYQESNKTITLLLEEEGVTTAEVENLTSNHLTLVAMQHDFDGDGTDDKLIRIFKK
ncbi:lipocalin family protein [Epilithonimonas arachidiradicis]|uniref:Lipocalin-like protein n=1 Tax=Epilithonimonas arachidiradicis TaxID=1617282 RepID=A0A420CPS4_9FLAO|nr:lipocalin family protein [Epilithonimonas arachidiradicis]RKE80420.1 lipocalin-like protein [Epilithonimonas arachidiradicis]